MKQPDEPLIPALATPAFVPSPQGRTDILFGPLGLRAGWGILAYFVLAILLGLGLVAGLLRATGTTDVVRREQRQGRQAAQAAKAAHRLPPPQTIRVGETLLMEGAETAAVLLAAGALCFVERRRFGVYGLGLRHGRDLLPGAVTGLASIGVLVGALWASHVLVFDARMLHGVGALRLGLGWLLAFLLVGLFEEFFFRGYIQFTLMRGLLRAAGHLSPAHMRAVAFWLAAVIWSLLFSATHIGNAGEDPVGLAMVFLAGVVFSYALWRTGSLWWGVGFHMTWDWGQSFLFGVPDSGTLSAGRLFATHAQGRTVLSGGTTGPEGSVLAVAVLLLVMGVIRLHPQREQPPVAPEEGLPVVPRGPRAESIP